MSFLCWFTSKLVTNDRWNWHPSRWVIRGFINPGLTSYKSLQFPAKSNSSPKFSRITMIFPRIHLIHLLEISGYLIYIYTYWNVYTYIYIYIQLYIYLYNSIYSIYIYYILYIWNLIHIISWIPRYRGGFTPERRRGDVLSSKEEYADASLGGGNVSWGNRGCSSNV